MIQTSLLHGVRGTLPTFRPGCMMHERKWVVPTGQIRLSELDERVERLAAALRALDSDEGHEWPEPVGVEKKVGVGQR